MGDDGLDLVRRRDVHADLQAPVLPPLGAPFPAASFVAQAMHDVLRDEAALLGVGEDGSERAQHLAHHRRRAVLAQPVLEGPHQRGGQLRQLHATDQRGDVKLKVLPVGVERGPL